MANTVPPILVTVEYKGMRAFCIGDVVRGDDHEFYLEPTMPPPDPSWPRLGRTKLVGKAIQPPQDIGAGSLIHTYQGILKLP